MKRSIFFLGAIIFYIIPLFAQAPDTLWTKTYGGLYNDEGLCVQQTFDGGFIISGYKEVLGGILIRKVYLVKTDEFGDTLWTRIYGNLGNHVGNWVQQTSDSGYIVVGGITHFNNNIDVYLIKTDSNGDILWQRIIGGLDYNEGNCVRETTDGGYIIVGYTKSFGAGISDVYLIKTDANGVVDWTRTYGGQLWEQGNSVQQTSDSGFVLVGYKTISTSPSGADSDVYLIKTDANGDTLWTRLYGVQEGQYREEGWSVQQTSDGGYIVTGETWYPGSPAWEIDVYLIKTDANGDTLWTKTYDRDERTDVGRSIQLTLDGGYIIAGYTHIFATNYDVYLIKTDAIGDTTWTMNLGRDDPFYPYDEGWSVQQTSDGGYIISGLSWGNKRDVYLIRLAPKPTQIETEVDGQLPQSFALYQNYPNPFNPTTTIKYQLPELSYVTIKIYDILGREVATVINEEKPGGSYEVAFDATTLSSGIYFYRLQTGSFVETKKMVLLR